MADQLDAPGLVSPAMDARVDITDHYAFQKPDHPDRTILIFNVNPLAPSHAAEFRSDAVYETLVDTNGDAKPEIVFQCRFTAKDDHGPHNSGSRRSTVLRWFPQRSLLLRPRRLLAWTAVHRRRLLHRQERVRDRAGHPELPARPKSEGWHLDAHTGVDDDEPERLTQV